MQVGNIWGEKKKGDRVFRKSSKSKMTKKKPRNENQKSGPSRYERATEKRVRETDRQTEKKTSQKKPKGDIFYTPYTPV